MMSKRKDEGKKLEAARKEALSRVSESVAWLAQQESPEFDYESVPFIPIKTVRVRYKHLGVMKPLPYPLDD